MNTALVVVDAWNTSKSSFHKEKPMWDKDVKDNVKSFSNFINYVCRHSWNGPPQRTCLQ